LGYRIDPLFRWNLFLKFKTRDVSHNSQLMKIIAIIYLSVILISLKCLSQTTQYRFKVEYPSLDSISKVSGNTERFEQKKVKTLPKFIDIFQHQNNFIETMWGYNGLYLNNKIFSENDSSIFFVNRSNVIQKDTSSYNSSEHFTIKKQEWNQYLIEEQGAFNVIIHLKKSLELPDSIKVEKHLNNYPEFLALKYFDSIDKIQISSGFFEMTLIPFEKTNIDSDSLIFQEFFKNINLDKERDDFFAFIERTKSELEPFEIDGVLHRVNSQDTILVLDQSPQCNCSIDSYFMRHIKYPKASRRNKTQGTVILSFLVKPDGSLENIEIVQSVSPEIDQEALRVVKNMPKWIPASYRNSFFSTKISLPISFKL
jgi:TonB family protein